MAISWYKSNQGALEQELRRVQTALDRHVAQMHRQDVVPMPDQPNEVLADDFALATLCKTFQLSHFECDLLLLCAGVELDSAFAASCAAAQGEGLLAAPTFSLALAALADTHWSAIAPDAPLRRWHLIEVGVGQTLVRSPLRISERVLHYLVGLQQIDERLATLVRQLSDIDLVPTHEALAQRAAAAWQERSAPLPVLYLFGAEQAARHGIAAAIGAAHGLRVVTLAASDVPVHSGERVVLERLWQRESALGGFALLINGDPLDAGDMVQMRAVTEFIADIGGPLMVAEQIRRLPVEPPSLQFEIGVPTAPERVHAWRTALGSAAAGLNGQIEVLAHQFQLDLSTLQAASAEALAQVGDDSQQLAQALWDGCRVQARSRTDELAQRIVSAAAWSDLVLPAPQLRTLRTIALHVRHRATVYDRWGFAAKGERGLGIAALFAGPPGTGKTLAAEVIANELRLDLYRIDLSAVVSKYIGETEKHLRQLFDAAEASGAVLLFDEADALFGKRSEVKDSHDRYANIEVGYLLQRLETYRGLAILTTNMKHALDPAFLRRIRFVVQFPFPDATQRMAIWRQIFPHATPTTKLDAKKLAQLNVAGGNIRNIALSAAFLAAEASEPVQMAHLLEAARTEYTKLEKTLTEAEIAEWV